MLDILRKSQPKQFLAAYVEPTQVEVIRGRRKWRTWDFDRAEVHRVQGAESVFDLLQRVNVHLKDAVPAACLVILARTFYSFHREYYPLALADQVNDVIQYDWEENLFLESDRALHFAGTPVFGSERIAVPIYSLRRDLYEKFCQALGSSSFRHFTLVPDALLLKDMITELPGDENRNHVLIGRHLGDQSLELHQVSGGAVVESLLLKQGHSTAALFARVVDLITDSGDEQGPTVVVCSKEGERTPQALPVEGNNWDFQEIKAGRTLVETWAQNLTRMEPIQAFGDRLALKPRQLPRVVYPIVVGTLLYGLFGFYQVHTYHRLTRKYKALEIQRHQLEAKWKPIEKRQARLAQLKEARKSLKEFDAKGYPLLKLLTLLTDVTPMDTWIEYFALNGKELRLRGRSKAAVKYVSKISQIEGFSKVSLVSPIRRDTRTGSERFYLRIEIDPPKLKKRLESVPILAEEQPASGALRPQKAQGKQPGTGSPKATPAKEQGGKP